MVNLDRTEVRFRVVANLLESGVITHGQIDDTIDQVIEMSDDDLLWWLLHSHKIREEVSAQKCYRCSN